MRNKIEYDRVDFRIPKDLKKLLMNYSIRLGVPMTNVLILILREKLDEYYQD